MNWKTASITRFTKPKRPSLNRGIQPVRFDTGVADRESYPRLGLDGWRKSMRWIRAFASWQAIVGLLVLLVAPMAVQTLTGVETTTQVGKRAEQIDLDPSVEEAPALPALSTATETKDASVVANDAETAVSDDLPASQRLSHEQEETTLAAPIAAVDAVLAAEP